MIKKTIVNNRTFIEETKFYIYEDQGVLAMEMPTHTTDDEKEFQSILKYELNEDRKRNDPFNITINKLYPILSELID